MAICSLLALPIEIRQKIYQYVFADSPISFKVFEVDKKLFSWFRKDPVYRWVLTSPPPDQLLDTCRQIRHEAIPELRASLQVSCDITERAASSVKTVIPLRGFIRSSIRFLHLIAHTEYTFWPQNEMPSLRHVLVESKYNVRLFLHRSADGTVDRSASALIDAIKLWHLDLLNEPEIPDGPGSWGLLKAILHPKRPYVLEWKGPILAHYEGLWNGPPATTAEVDLQFDWDTMQVLAGEDQILAMAEMHPFG